MDLKPPIINCHTHVFTGDSVPPYLGKKFMMWPLPYIFTTRLILNLANFWYNNKTWSPHNFPIHFWYRRLQHIHYRYRAFMRRHLGTHILVLLFNSLLILHAVYFLFKSILISILGVCPWMLQAAIDTKYFLVQNHLFYPDMMLGMRILLIAFVFFFIREGRKVLTGLIRRVPKLGGLWPDNTSIAFYKRYLNLGRFANYTTSSGIFGRLEKQYEKDTGFILLPMDMEFMEAGPVREEGTFEKQMNELAKIKTARPNTAFPFVFIDPRRITADTEFLKYNTTSEPGKVLLDTCFVKTFIETNRFNGFKIYPALGYYPFDDRLLLLWKYAADNQIPLMTHAIRGTIFFRGRKNKKWGYHPVFEQTKGRKNSNNKVSTGTEPLLLPQLRNVDYINNFTHPLNYFCLVEEKALRHVLHWSENDVVKDFFGFKDIHTKLKYDLSHLKICFGHYGGEDEWKRYLELDRNQYTPQLTSKPTTGLDFLSTGEFSPVKMEQLWKQVDWYTLISSMMLQYDNLYADISYIIHDPEIIPLLKTSLQYPKLRERILFGTDFYVVRNHKSEREMLGELQANLSEADFDQIARINPVSYLHSINYPAQQHIP